MGHSAQGKTLPQVLINLHEGGFAAYVAASRAQTRKGLCITQPVTVDFLNKRIPSDLSAEVQHFEAIEHNTLVKHGLCQGPFVPVPDAESEQTLTRASISVQFDTDIISSLTKKHCIVELPPFQANASHPVPRRLPAGFFDDMQGRDPSSTASPLHYDPSLTRRRRTFALPWGSRPRALLARLPQFFRRSQPNADEPTELQQRPGPSTSSRRSPPIVEVPALDDKKALYTARRPERASDKAKCIKNPTWRARIVLFICCVSPSTDDGH
ncbi:hypothetical protein F4604DRAFT_1928998 [Suillus subluteus]|nr:hypothetical protein F4604DRAFT_1928998 [Suillus subluteus]